MNKKNILIYAIVFFVIFTIEFGLNSYFSFTLEKEQYLFYQNIVNVLPLFTTLLGFGTPFAVVYMTSLSKSNNKLYLYESNLFTLYLSLILFGFTLILLNFQYIELYIIVSLVLGFFNAIKQNSVNYYLAKKELNISSFIRLNQKVIYVLVILFGLIFLSIKSNQNLSILLILGEVIGLLILTIKYKIFIIKKFKKIKSIIKISRYAFMANIFSMISLATPILLLNYFDYPTNEIISFSIAYTLLKYSGILLGPFMQLITPYFTPIKNDIVKVKRLYIKFSLVIFVIGLTLSVLMYFLSPFIISMFFNQEYSQSSELFTILIFAIPFLFLNSFSMSLISSVINVKLTSKIVFITMIISIFTEYYLLSIYGLNSLVYFIVFNYFLLFIISFLILIKNNRGLLL